MLLLNKHSVEASIEDRYASIVYSFDFENISKNGSSELKFELTIDSKAFISSFEANIDGQVFIGETKEKEKASKEYSEAKEKDENAILISKPYDDIPNVFEIKTNIDSKSKISLDITIQQYIEKKFNFNELNIQILRNFSKYNIIQNVQYISFKIDIKDKSGIYEINTDHNMIIHRQTMDKLKKHFSANGRITNESSMNELMIKYKIKGEQSDSMVLFDKKSHTFCHIISDIITDSMIQNEQDIDADVLIPRRVVFVMDKSGSMSGGKWNKAISATITAIKQLRISYDRYCIVFFNRNTEMVPNNGIISATNQSIDETISYLENMNAGGGTNINSALIQAIDLIKSDITLNNDNFFMNQIVLITDGEPNSGERDPNKIISNVQMHNNTTNISIFSFGVGSDANDSSWIKDLNHSFLKLLSVNNNGFYKRIKSSNTDTQLMQYFDILSKPILSNIKIEYKNKNIKNITNTMFHTLYDGNDIIICGQIGDYNDDEKHMCLDLTITAITAKQMKPIGIYKNMKMNIDIEKDNNNIERIWAYLQLQQFAQKQLIHNDLIELSDDEKKSDDVLPLSLAMKYKFVTPWTSMIVVKKKDEMAAPIKPNSKEISQIADHSPPFVPKVRADVDCCYFDSIDDEQYSVSTSSKSADKSHFWGYTFKRSTNTDVLQSVQSNTISTSGPSKETLEKVQRMKRQCEKSIGSRIKATNQRRLRTLRIQHTLKQNNDVDEQKRHETMPRSSAKKMSLKDFKLIRVVAKDRFSEERVVHNTQNNTIYSMKPMRKKDLVLKNQTSHVNVERDLMAVAESEWLVKLHFSFQDDAYLYLVREHCIGGNLMQVLMKKDILSEKDTRFYMVELAAAINAVHELNIVHRDLKPSNILITESGHIKLCDFSLATHFHTESDEIISEFQNKKHLLIDDDDDAKETRYEGDLPLGCAAYIAPEVFGGKGYDKMVDYWSIGVIMFECCVGFPPFYAKDPLQTCRKIVHYRKYFKIPKDIKLSKECVDLLCCLICSYRRRYGFEQIKQHSFFKKK